MLKFKSYEIFTHLKCIIITRKTTKTFECSDAKFEIKLILQCKFVFNNYEFKSDTRTQWYKNYLLFGKTEPIIGRCALKEKKKEKTIDRIFVLMRFYLMISIIVL